MDGRPSELVEYHLLLLLCHADTVVAHLQQHMFVGIPRLDLYPDLVLRILHRIVYQVSDGLGQILLIGQQILHFQTGGDLDGFRSFRLRLFHQIVDDRFDIDVPLIQDQFLIFQFRDRQQLVHQRQQMFCLVFDDCVVFFLDLRLVVHLTAVQEVCSHDDRTQR